MKTFEFLFFSLRISNKYWINIVWYSDTMVHMHHCNRYCRYTSWFYNDDMPFELQIIIIFPLSHSIRSVWSTLQEETKQTEHIFRNETIAQATAAAATATAQRSVTLKRTTVRMEYVCVENCFPISLEALESKSFGIE